MNDKGYGSLFAGYNADATRERLVVPRGHVSAHKQIQKVAPVQPKQVVDATSVKTPVASVVKTTKNATAPSQPQVKIQPRWRPSFKTPATNENEAVVNHTVIKRGSSVAPVVSNTADSNGFMKTMPVYGYEELPLDKKVAKAIAQPQTAKSVTHHVAKRPVNPFQPSASELRREEAVKLAAAQKRREAAKKQAEREAKIELARQQAEYQAQRIAREQAEADNKAELMRRAHARAAEEARQQARAKADQLTQAMLRMNAPAEVVANQQSAASRQAVAKKHKVATKPVAKTVAKNVKASSPVAKATHVAAAPTISFDPLPATLPTPMASAASAMTTNNESAKSADNTSVSNDIQASGDAAVMPNPAASFLERLSNIKIAFTFKINKQRVLTVLRYLAIAVIIVASAYLAWDTYATNQTVKSSFSSSSPASAMSIAGANPATADQTAVSQEAKAAYTAPADQPRYITIPAINVNARVMSVGVNSKGNIDTPSNLNDTAWYDGSAKPGQEGQVFIDGHTSFSNTINAAFNDLPKLREGNQIVVETGNGTKYTYKVTTVKTVDANKVDMGEALNPPVGAKKGLTLMTCTGTFNYRTQTADKRLVVYAVQI